MRLLTSLLSIVCAWMVVAGLWLHDWRLIVAGLVTAVVWLWIGDDVAAAGDNVPTAITRMDDDPYGTATDGIKQLVRMAILRSDRMSGHELANLIAVEELLRARDNA